MTKQDFKIAMLGGPEYATRMTCREAKCQNEAKGWAVVLDPSNEKHAAMARYIEGNSGRQFIMQRSEDALDYFVNHGVARGIVVDDVLLGLLRRTAPGMFVYVFPPGQQCFTRHQDREVVFSHESGGSRRVHTRPLDFNEDYNIEADGIRRMVQRG